MAARPYTKAPAMAPAIIYNWTGFYIGGHVGGAFRGNSNNVLGGGDDGRFMGGGQIGWDTQFAPNCHSACNIDPVSRGIGVQNCPPTIGLLRCLLRNEAGGRRC
jgi:hypothetical protein